MLTLGWGGGKSEAYGATMASNSMSDEMGNVGGAGRQPGLFGMLKCRSTHCAERWVEQEPWPGSCL